MRPNQQNRRIRGRGNRKGPNPLTRNYESNGPDVKIRGSAQQIAEKYTALARDMQVNGDRVMAENYLQHAEHYNRIIAAAQGQMPLQNQRDYRDEDDEDEQEAAYNGAADRPANDGSGPQPVIEGTPAEVALTEEAVSENVPSPSPEAAERKPAARRTRRPRKDTVKAEDAPAGGNGEASPKGEAGETAARAAAGDASEAPAVVNG